MALILGLVSAYFIYGKYKTAKNQELSQKYALITAQSWIATAKFMDEPEKYIAFRESLLAAQNITIVEIEFFLSEYKEEAEKYVGYAGFVKFYVDSLVAIEDSILKTASDTVKSLSTPDS
ncbi:MAG: hypothetical protein IH931_01320 [candidate division Zixibacteria bacterium]|nr:hypothetical protein [candidate division Zixibacteria bacterium]